MAEGILESMRDEITTLKAQTAVLQAQVHMLATLMGLDVKEQFASGKPLQFTDLGLVQRGKYLYRSDKAPKVELGEVSRSVERAMSRELSPDDLIDEIE